MKTWRRPNAEDVCLGLIVAAMAVIFFWPMAIELAAKLFRR